MWWSIFSYGLRYLLPIIVSRVAESMADPVMISRAEWNAKPPKEVDSMATPVPFVVIHHSYIPPACHDTEKCIAAMISMQKYHQDHQKWNDIGYSFAVGGDGKAYEGRGWTTIGAHAPRFNNISIGICIIGDWRTELPPEQQLMTVHQLINMGIREGKIAADYKLIGHRQVRQTDCPGDKLFNEIMTWPNFHNNPNDTLEEMRKIHVEEKHPVESNKLKRNADIIATDISK